MLLSDPETAKLLNTEFVPCWDTVRPVPQVTIDFGNGHTLKRTLAGNTVISICAADGRVLDAYPGVYTPAAFKGQISDTLGLFRKLTAAPAPAEQAAELAAWHREQFVKGVRAEGARLTLSKAFVESPLLAALGVPPAKAFGYGQAAPAGDPPPAIAVPATPSRVLTTTSKAIVQSTVMKALTPDQVVSPTAAPPGVPATGPTSPSIDPLADPQTAFAQFSERIEDVSKRAATVRQLRRTTTGPDAPKKTPEQIGKEAVEADATINIRAIRPAVHLWFMANGAPRDARSVRDVMYRDLLHVPVDDPYLGLADALVPGTPPGR